jgi:SAM-dependent methyltransferase
MGLNEPSISYWDEFYAQGPASALVHQSLFASKLIESTAPETLILDIGCGNGRDAKYFRSLGFDVIAVDGSFSALNALQNSAAYFELGKNVFKIDFSNEAEVNASLESDEIHQFRYASSHFVIYNRFFLHSISIESQENFLRWSNSLLTQNEEIHSEYRSPHEGIVYEFGDHFRREISASDLESRLRVNGFHNVSSQSSLEFAPYKNERPLVTRTIARK